MPRKPKTETKIVQQALSNSGRDKFMAELNALLLDGWRVVPGTFNHTRVPGVPSANTPARFINEHGVMFEPHFFIVIEIEEVVDVAAKKRVREAAAEIEERRLQIDAL